MDGGRVQTAQMLEQGGQRADENLSFLADLALVVAHDVPFAVMKRPPLIAPTRWGVKAG